MVKKKKIRQGKAILTFCLFVSVCVSVGGVPSKKLEVTAATAHIHMQPDANSPVIETLYRGEVLTLASARKFKKVWNYVYFTSNGSGSLKSGYVHDSSVTKLYNQTRAITLHNENEAPKEDKPEASVGNIQWGMQSHELVNVLGSPLASQESQEEYVLTYQRSAMNMECLVDYIFSRDRLVKTRYVFGVKYAQKTQYIEEFIKMSDFFQQQYGEPKENNRIWHDKLYEEEPTKWGEAVGLGHLSYETRWTISETEIALTLTGAGDRISLELLYTYLEPK